MNYDYIRITKDQIKDGKNNFEIPKYQRNLVWKSSKRIKLIKSVQEGFPIGTMLLYENKNKKFQIIDGLQRFSTLQDYFNEPMKYIKESDKLNKLLMKEFKNEKHIIKIYEFLEKEIHDMNVLSMEIFMFLEGEFSLDKKTARELSKKIIELINDEHGQVEKIIIPAILYKGSEENLPKIFENINTTGTQLSRFDILAASWPDYEVKFSSEDVLKKIQDRYENMYQELEIEIEYEKETFKPAAFDFAYGLGAFLNDRFPSLFKSKKGFSTSPVGFNLLSLEVFKNVSDIEKLSTLWKRTKEENDKSIKNIIEACEMVDKYLTLITINKLTSKKSYVLTEYQVYSLIGYVMKMKYENSFDERDFQNYAWKRCLVDLLKNYWSGSGDSKVNAVMQQSDKVYEVDVNYKNFVTLFEGYMENENKSTKLQNVSSLNKQILSILFQKSGIDTLKKMDIEHITPKTYLTKKENLPVSPLSNLTFLPKFDNRSKGKMTIWQLQKKQKSEFFDLIKDKLKDYHYPTKEELNFVASNNINENTYKKFLAKRTKMLVKLFEKIVKDESVKAQK
ncbi:DUF262 domain-containing protein [Mycoplasma todarodis]|uniref:GmrSD restriction endonucleases N-terminal domain-containing protein n=1 Tax=Mycoplasma todarodis TaxID=1937191 RepID=A0A4R0XTV2_9MOLU|nr:DUF262 domain-containing protein [Mycoplasma todarodis]TCG11079.1 hypothetical protein C4B25_02420 [Mycoplasma todarodis]